MLCNSLIQQALVTELVKAVAIVTVVAVVTLTTPTTDPSVPGVTVRGRLWPELTSPVRLSDSPQTPWGINRSHH